MIQIRFFIRIIFSKTFLQCIIIMQKCFASPVFFTLYTKMIMCFSGQLASTCCAFVNALRKRNSCGNTYPNLLLNSNILKACNTLSLLKFSSCAKIVIDNISRKMENINFFIICIVNSNWSKGN